MGACHPRHSAARPTELEQATAANALFCRESVRGCLTVPVTFRIEALVSAASMLRRLQGGPLAGEDGHRHDVHSLLAVQSEAGFLIDPARSDVEREDLQ